MLVAARVSTSYITFNTNCCVGVAARTTYRYCPFAATTRAGLYERMLVALTVVDNCGNEAHHQAPARKGEEKLEQFIT